jgi:hypothetical protein
MVFEQAQKIGAPKVIFGFGAEMLLGNLKIARIAHRIALVEKIVPFWILKFIYRVIARIKGFSKNQTEFLLSQSWVDRFLHARGPLLIHEKKYFKKTPVPFVDHYKIEAHRILALPAIGLLDKFVLMYVYSWVNYLQAREFTAMGKKFDAVPVMPFDSIKTMRALFRTPDQFRKLNNWNKQVIRDVFRPYTTPDMYTGRVGSLIIPYNTWFKDTHKPFIDYLRTSKIIMEAVDLDVFERLYETLPEPGLSLMRLLGIALWYDANWDTDNMKNFDAIFPLLTSASQATNLQG